jgi:hypothetical protein
MYEGKSVAVVVPAYNEEALIASTVSTIPAFVDRIIVVDDGSNDGPSRRRRTPTRASISSSTSAIRASARHRHRLQAGDAEEDRRHGGHGRRRPDGPGRPGDARPGVAPGEVDYAEGEQALHRPGVGADPAHRYLGNARALVPDEDRLGLLARADSQSGYTAVDLETLELLDLDRIYKRYGFPNDLLVHLNVWNRRVRDYPSRPIYGVGERSGIRCATSSRRSPGS